MARQGTLKEDPSQAASMWRFTFSAILILAGTGMNVFHHLSDALLINILTSPGNSLKLLEGVLEVRKIENHKHTHRPDSQKYEAHTLL